VVFLYLQISTLEVMSLSFRRFIDGLPCQIASQNSYATQSFCHPNPSPGKQESMLFVGGHASLPSLAASTPSPFPFQMPNTFVSPNSSATPTVLSPFHTSAAPSYQPRWLPTRITVSPYSFIAVGRIAGRSSHELVFRGTVLIVDQTS